MQTETKTPKYIQGYWRNKQTEPEAKREDGGAVIAAIMLGGTILIAAIAFWYVTLGAAAIGATAYGIRKYAQRPQQNELVINYNY